MHAAIMAITIELTNGQRDSRLSGIRQPLDEAPAWMWLIASKDLQPVHARIIRVAGRWMVESAGDWLLQVGDSVPGRKQWLNLTK